MHMAHGLGQEMSMESCLTPHLFEESKNFLRRNLSYHMNNQKPRETEGQRGCSLLVFVDLISRSAQLRGRLDTELAVPCSPASGLGHAKWLEAIEWGYGPTRAP